MAQYIDKDALVAEINRQQRRLDIVGQTNELELRKNASIQNGVYCYILSFLNTLEVKEVDLEKELDEWMKYGPHTSYPWCTIPNAIKITAEHFFELGFKTQKG